MRLLYLKTVVVATDLTATSEPALRSAAALADAAGAALHVAHVAPEDSGIIAHTGRRAEFLHELAQATKRAGVPDTHTPHVLNGNAADAIAALASRLSADVIVTGRRRRQTPTPMDRALGGTAYAIITRADVPCLAVDEPLRMPSRRVLVAIDSSESARGAMLAALSWSSALRDRKGDEPVLTALHAHSEGTESRADSERTLAHELKLTRGDAGDWAGVSVAGVTVPAKEPVSAIAEFAERERSDLIVLGTRGLREGEGARLGSVSAAVLGRVRAPVLLVPPAVWRAYRSDKSSLVG